MEDQIKELMGFVQDFGGICERFGDFEKPEDAVKANRLLVSIESKLRAMLESSAVAEREACAKVLDVRVEILDKEAKKQRRGGDVMGIGGEMEAAAASCEAAAYEIRARSIGGE